MPQISLNPIPKYFLFLFLVGFSIVSCSKENDDLLFESNEKNIDEVSVNYSEIELQIFSLVNKYRSSKGLKALESMNVISSVAESHSKYMTKNGSVSHDNFFERHKLLVNSVNAKIVGENVGFGYNTAQGIVTAWIESEGHREIIENANYTHFGISIEKDTNGKNYFTQIFIKR